MSLSTLSADFKALKQIKGHWDGEDYNPDVDAFQGRKHKTMELLLEQLKDSDAQTIAHNMGEPDEMQTRGVVLMPGPFMVSKPEGGEKDTGFRMIYYWRGKHDYIYFDIDSESERVVNSGWFNAME